ncbi:MAG: glycine cleavage system protein H [Promethearchaeota archaeon]
MVQIGDYEMREDRVYSPNHLWILSGTGGVTIGVDPMGYSIAGNISMIRVKKEGKPLKKDKAFGTMESGKGVISLKSPVNGTILEVNSLLSEKKFKEILEDPYEQGWLIKAELSDPSELDTLIKDVADISSWAKEELAKMK